MKLNTWSEVLKFTDKNLRISPTYLSEVGTGKYPCEAFSLGQLASKAWLIRCINQYVNPLQANVTVAILGSWIGVLVEFLHQSFLIDRIYGIDLDEFSIKLSEELNKKHVNNSWKYKGVVADVLTLSTNNMEFLTDNELINVKPEWIINASCEHMGSQWFNTADSDQLIKLQTNNYHRWHEHTNTVDSITDMQDKYPLSNTLYAGELDMPLYTRYMQIGYK